MKVPVTVAVDFVGLALMMRLLRGVDSVVRIREARIARYLDHLKLTQL